MISVIIPSYNRANIIERSAKSVLNQTYKDIELIIVDDCSSDNTEEVVAEFAKYDSRVRYIRHEKNQGACVARNTGIDAAKGEYIAFQDSDDLWYPEKLEKQMAALESTGAEILFCKYKQILGGKFDRTGPGQYEEGFLNPVEDVFGIGTQTLIAKRYVFEEFRFDSALPRFQDLELLIRVTEKYKLYCMDTPLVEYYMDNADSISRKPERIYTAGVIILKKHPDIAKKMPKMGKTFASQLINDISYAEENQGISKKDIYKLALAYDRSWKCKVKVALRVVGLYEAVMGAREKQKNNPNGK